MYHVWDLLLTVSKQPKNVELSKQFRKILNSQFQKFKDNVNTKLGKPHKRLKQHIQISFELKLLVVRILPSLQKPSQPQISENSSLD